MKLYDRVIPGVFLERPNRFIARVRTEEGEEICHVKNTGRCRELLLPGAPVYLSVSENPARKTRCDLVAVRKGALLINMDSQAPNRAAGEALPWLFPGLTRTKPEAPLGGSRLDFYLEQGEKKTYLEVKGVTLEENGDALFPDAPTARGEKHLRELTRCAETGLGAAVLFVIQMQGPRRFLPNARTDPAFARALRQAWDAGVRILAYDCAVTASGMTLCREIPVIL
ncbi:MAG: DNA/RNA nuclease SfsA [Clostridia bacterium]|nr:DNA/RNA nuclease SfsA [Clostridia bacterium]